MPAPAPGATYRTLLKQAMRSRQERILFLTALATHILLSIALFSVRALARPVVAVGTVALVALVALPTLLERRTRLIQAPKAIAKQPPSSRGAHLLDVVRAPEVWGRALRHALRAALGAMLYAGTATHAYGWACAVAPTVFVESHQAYYINETFLVLLFTAAWAGALYAVSDAWRTPRACWDVPAFDPDVVVRPTTLRERTLSTLGRRVPHAWLLAPVLVVPFLVYVLVRDAFWASVLRIVGVQTVVRPYIVPSFRVMFRPWHMLATVLPVALLLLTLFAVVYTLFDVYWTHPLPMLSARARDPNAALLGGLNDVHPFFVAHAYSELARIALYDRQRRAVLFDDVQRLHGRPVAWNGVYSACIYRLDALLKEAPKKEAQREAPPQAAAPRPSVWRALADAPAPKPAEKKAPAPAPAPPAADTALFKFVRIAAYGVHAALRALLRLIPSDAKHALLPQALHLAFAAPSPALVLDAELLAPRAVVCWAALAMEHLVDASLSEDKYGSVQKDIGRVVQALLHAHERLQTLRRSVERQALDADNQLVREAQVVRGALKEAGADAATFSTSYAPFYNELQTTWHVAYATLDTALSQSAQRIVQTFAPYGFEK